MAEDHAVRQGESVMSIAQENGFLWETIWNHPKNAQLKAKRVDPNVLMPGDVVHIPDRQERKESGGADQSHTFKRKGIPAVVRIAFRKPKEEPDEKVEQKATDPSEYEEPDPKPSKDEPMADVPFALYADGKLVKEGKTGGDGKLEAGIPTSARSAWVVFHPGTAKERTLDLNIREMDPIEEIPGICKRLNNLGFPCPVEEKEITPPVADALRAFQRQNGLEPTGKADGKTRDLLKKAHGS